MKPKHQRLWFVLVSMVLLIAGSLLVSKAFRDNLIFFYTPSELSGQTIAPNQLIRIGGVVKTGSIEKPADNQVRFTITDHAQEVAVYYEGMLPALFRDEQGVVAEGYLKPSGQLQATRVLTKHDENYMPQEVVERLKQSGRWQESR